jgi:signal transduction histidine kinase/CheY-like chemotaxis protein
VSQIAWCEYSLRASRLNHVEEDDRVMAVHAEELDFMADGVAVGSSLALSERDAFLARPERPLHVVQFYEDDTFLVETVARFVGAGLRDGDSSVVIATEPHRDAILARLEGWSFDVRRASGSGRLVMLDAAETLAAFMRGDVPDAESFERSVGALMKRVYASSRGKARVRAYGEMVDLLRRKGQSGAALRVEELWNEMARVHPFSLLCGYSLATFSGPQGEEALMNVCGRHASVFPAETFASLRTDDERAREISMLQHRARVLASQLEHTKQLERKLEEVVLELESANRSRDLFLATVSHELRTPLNAILGWARMLRSGSLPIDKRERALETIERNADVQTQLVEDLLDVSQMSSGKVRLAIRRVDPVALVRNAADAVRLAAGAKGVRLTESMTANVGAIQADPDRLQQVARNLLTNAVKFTHSGGHVDVGVRRCASSIEIRVADTGQGIDKTFLPLVFERFQQADATSTRQHAGLGLGLAIVRHLVELHGGTVHAASDGLGRGATFTVLLPVAPTSSPVFGSRPAVPLASTDAARQLTRLDGVFVLVVDDERDARELLCEVLTSCGARVATASTAGEAVELLERLRPDMLISDIGMPGEDGYALISAVRALAPERGGRTPAVALTAYTRFEDRTRALAAGFNMHVPKPFEPTKLVRTLSSLAALGHETQR